MEQDDGRFPSGPGHSRAEPVVSAVPASVPSAEVLGLNLSKASPEQLGEIASCLTSLIGMHAESVRTAQERYEKDCAFLAELMAALSRVTHFIARIGADALEEQYAQMAEAGTAETVGLDPQGESAVRQDAP